MNKLSKKINERFDKKQNELQRMPAVIGDGQGHVSPSGVKNLVYCIIGNNVATVFNSRVTPKYGTRVWVGYAPEEPTLFQVLSTRSESPSLDDVGAGYAPAKRYEWMATGGGQDPLWVHLRAFTFLRLTPAGGMVARIERGWIRSAGVFINVPQSDTDLTAYVPSGTSAALFVLLTIDNAGAVTVTVGATKTLSTLTAMDIPDAPSNAEFICGAVRLYDGQTEIRESRVNTDIVDLRFTRLSTSSGGVAWGDITGTLSAQTDLQSALDERVALLDADYVELTNGGVTSLHSHGSGAGSFAFQRILSGDLTMATGETIITSAYIDTNGHDIIMAADGDCEIVIL